MAKKRRLNGSLRANQTRNCVFAPIFNHATNSNATPCPVIAALAHYQYATIHPYLDGNGRSARILASIIITRGGYDLKGIYSLEEYYAKDLPAYYEAISIGPSPTMPK